MSEDIVLRLLAPSELTADLSQNKLHYDAANTIERLRAQVWSLRVHLNIYLHAHRTGNSVPPHIEKAARAALEAKL
jgi:hypothetical protein